MMQSFLTFDFLITILTLAGFLTQGAHIARSDQIGSSDSFDWPSVSYLENIRENIDCDYLIITSNVFSRNANLMQFAEHRSEKDLLKLAIVDVDHVYLEFGNTNSAHAIKLFLQYAYENWNSSRETETRLLYVLLVGEGEEISPAFIPTYTYRVLGDSMKSDHWYACLNDDNNDAVIDDSDMSPDLLIGRFSVDNNSELEAIVSKTIAHDLSDWSSPWRRDISLFSSFDERDELLIISDLYENISNAIDTQDYFQLSEAVKLRLTTKDDFSNRFISTMNQGCCIINVNAHGSVDSWSDGYGWNFFTTDDVLDLSNQHRYPIILNFSCKSGNFTAPNQDCLAELLTNHHDKGAVAFWGATANNDGSRLFNQALLNALINYENIPLGHYLILARQKATPEKCYNLLGDPALRVRRSVVNRFIDLTVDPDDVYYYENNNLSTDKFTFEVSITNRGFHIAHDVKVLICDKPPESGGTILFNDRIHDIPPHHANRKISISIPGNAVDNFSYYVSIDPEDEIVEYDESNNILHDSTQISIFTFSNDLMSFDKFLKSDLPFFFDYNTDGAMDMYMAGVNNILYKNFGSFQYTAIPSPSTLPRLDLLSQVFSLDINNNGYPDLVLNSPLSDQFLICYDISAETPWGYYFMTNDNLNIFQSILGFIDIDNNGVPDLLTNSPPYVMCPDEHNKYIPLDHCFPNLNHRMLNYVSAADYDQDLYCDLFVIDSDNKGYLLHNNGDKTFSDVSHLIDYELGYRFKMSLFQDIDNDKQFDLLLLGTRFNESVIMKYDQERFIVADYSFTPPLSHETNIAYFLDYDNDGWVDLFVNNGQSMGELYHNDSNFHFKLEPPVLTHRIYNDIKGLSIADIDDNGYMDLFAMREKSSPTFVFMRNTLAMNNWIKIKLQGTKSNASGLGANIQIYTADGVQMFYNNHMPIRNISTDPTISFGTRDSDKIDSVIIHWPSGVKDVVRDVPCHSLLTFREGYGNANIPSQTAILKNFPNPFNGSTQINYSIGGDPHGSGEVHPITLSVFNILGQKVITLLEQEQASGEHVIRWDGKDKNRQYLPTGVYFLVLTCNKSRYQHKILVLR